MIQKVEMYQAVCDGRGKGYVNENIGYCAWVDKESARENALEDTGWQEMIDGKLYCPDCVEYDEETDSTNLKRRRDSNERFSKTIIRSHTYGSVFTSCQCNSIHNLAHKRKGIKMYQPAC